MGRNRYSKKVSSIGIGIGYHGIVPALVKHENNNNSATYDLVWVSVLISGQKILLYACVILISVRTCPRTKTLLLYY